MCVRDCRVRHNDDEQVVDACARRPDGLGSSARVPLLVNVTMLHKLRLVIVAAVAVDFFS